MIADINTDKKIQGIIKDLFITCKNLNISLVFITQCYFLVQKDVRLNFAHYFLMKIHNQKEQQNITTDPSPHIDY